jgi:hypothetical protein
MNNQKKAPAGTGTQETKTVVSDERNTILSQKYHDIKVLIDALENRLRFYDLSDFEYRLMSVRLHVAQALAECYWQEMLTTHRKCGERGMVL